MKALSVVRPTREQLPIIGGNRLGAEVIRGAAGSGKTSTALLRLRSLAYMFHERRQRDGDSSPVRVLVLTFNRTLAGYVDHLARAQLDIEVSLFIGTFAKWAMNSNPGLRVDEDAVRQRIAFLVRRASIPGLDADYLTKEVDYIIGRFLPVDLDQYISVPRAGRGATPRVDRDARRKILEEIVHPYLDWLRVNTLDDWNTLAVKMASTAGRLNYDLVIVDECQDFSANQLRAIKHHLADPHAVTFVIDTVQRIYARGFTWQEVGFSLRPERFFTLQENHRNTREIAAFAKGLLAGLDLEPDGALPDLNSASRSGRRPVVLRGIYRNQLQWAVDFIRRHVNLQAESVAFLCRQASWLQFTREQLMAEGLACVDLTREPEWPTGAENIALCTFHSAKGLEFDHVFVLGLSNQNTVASDSDGDDEVWVQRRLLAVAVARARVSVCLGYKPGEESHLMSFFDPMTYDVVSV